MTDAAANTTQTDQQSSSAANQSQSGSQASSDGSQSTQTARPEYVPESYWDPATNSVKAQEFTTHIGELAALKAAQDARIAARPKDPAGYELKFNDTFKPEVAIKFDETDPRVAQVRALAHELNLDQPTFSRLLEIEAANTIAETKAYNAAVAAETAKLGANGTQRVTALKTWLTGALGAEAANDLLGSDNTGGLVVFSEAAVKHLEKLQLAMSNGGASTITNGGRETPNQPKPTVAQRLYGATTPQQKAS